jgi:hypothetical protein
MSATTPARLAPYIIRLYPRPWRARYELESLDLLALRPATWGDVWSLACHLVYHWLHPNVIADGVRAAPVVAMLATIWRVLEHAGATRRAE